LVAESSGFSLLDLSEAGFGGSLAKSEYLEIMEELETRALQSEALADLATFGKPEWYKPKFQFGL
jgi:hypothetical protein